MIDSVDFNKDVWVLVQRGAKSYLGKVSRKEQKIVVDGGNEHSIEDVKKAVAEILSIDGALRLNPCLEYFNNVIQNQGQIGRQPLPLPFDVTSGFAPVYVKADTLMFLDETEEQDRNTYKNMIEQTLEFFQQARASRAGIVTPSKAPLPPNVRPLR